MFISNKLKPTTRNINNAILEYDVYDSNHMYYMTERFELCSLTTNKCILNHINPFYKLNYVAMHLLQIQKTKEHFFIIQNINTENKIWDNLNSKRLNLYTYLKG